MLNAGDGMHEHPTQALLDLRTILRASAAGDRSTWRPETLAGVTVTIVGRHPAQPRGAFEHAAAAAAGRAGDALRPEGAAAGTGRATPAPASQIERDFEARCGSRRW